jgi:hypothetical protein
MATPELSPKQTQQILQTLAASNPDYASWVSDIAESAQTLPTLPAELVQDVLTALTEDPQQASSITALSQQADNQKNFTGGGEVALFMAVAFLLRTHIKIKRNTRGQWEFLIENKPGDNKLLSAVLKKLEDWLDNGEGN